MARRQPSSESAFSLISASFLRCMTGKSVTKQKGQTFYFGGLYFAHCLISCVCLHFAIMLFPTTHISRKNPQNLSYAVRRATLATVLGLGVRRLHSTVQHRASSEASRQVCPQLKSKSFSAKTWCRIFCGPISVSPHTCFEVTSACVFLN